MAEELRESMPVLLPIRRLQAPGLPTQAVAEGVKPTGCGQTMAIPTCVPNAKDPVTRNPPTPDPT
jgi:hypothetical protein